MKLRFAWIFLLALTGLTYTALPAYAAPDGSTGSKTVVRLTSKEITVRGKSLRAAIDDVYDKLIKARALKNIGSGKNIITDTVLPYIPIGTAFADAEKILRAAGFKVGPRGANPLSKNRYEVSATIEDYAPTLYGKTSMYISLEPPSKKDWTVVHNLSAEITRQTI